MENNKWEVTIKEIINGGKKYKVTRRFPEHSIAETKVFDSKKEALEQLKEWLQ